MPPPVAAIEAAGDDFSVVGLGQCSLDILGLVPRYPEADAKIDLDETLVQGGGPVATALVTLARLGEKTALVGRVGDDDFGMRIRQELKEEGVDCRHLVTQRGASSQFSFIAVERRRGFRNIFCHRGSTESLKNSDLPAGILQGDRVLHLDGSHLPAAIFAARSARGIGMLTVLDGGSWHPGLDRLLPWIDHLVVSRNFASTIFPGRPLAESLRNLLNYGAEAVTVTLGADGSRTLLRNGRLIDQPAFDVDVVDTTGCGDVFHGGYIYGLLRRWSMDHVLRFASACAALKATALGGRSGIPDRAAVDRFLLHAHADHAWARPDLADHKND